jgi:hypothetical protein
MKTYTSFWAYLEHDSLNIYRSEECLEPKLQYRMKRRSDIQYNSSESCALFGITKHYAYTSKLVSLHLTTNNGLPNTPELYRSCLIMDKTKSFLPIHLKAGLQMYMQAIIKM